MLVLGVAFAVRLLHLLDFARLPLFERPTVDAALYVDLARRLAQDFAADEAFYKPPLYPYLLALAWKLVGANWFLLRLPGVLFGTATCGVAWWLARRLFGPRVALLAGLFCAANRIAVYFEGELLEIGLVTLVHTSSLALVLWAGSSGRERDPAPRWRAAVAGLALGLGTVARPTLLLFDAVAIAWLGRRAAGPALAGLFLAVLPVTLHNAAHGGGFVLVSSNLGVNYYLGNNPRANGRIAASSELPANPAAAERAARALAEQAEGRALRASEVSGYWLRRGIAWDLAHPAAALGLFARKLSFAWNAAEISDNEDLPGLAHHLRVLRVLPIGMWLLAPLGLVGLVLAPRRREVHLLRWFVAAQVASLLPFFVVARFRLPWTPALAVLAAWATLEALVRLRGRVARGRFFGLLAAAGLFCGLPLFGVRAPVDFSLEYKIAWAYQESGRTDEALAWYREAIRREPRDALAHNALGVLLAERGQDLEGATRSIETALSLDPARTAQYAESLAGVHLRRGDPVAALRACARGLAAKPDASAERSLRLREAEAQRALGNAAAEARALTAALAAGLPEPRAAQVRQRLTEIGSGENPTASDR